MANLEVIPLLNPNQGVTFPFAPVVVRTEDKALYSAFRGFGQQNPILTHNGSDGVLNLTMEYESTLFNDQVIGSINNLRSFLRPQDDGDANMDVQVVYGNSHFNDYIWRLTNVQVVPKDHVITNPSASNDDGDTRPGNYRVTLSFRQSDIQNIDNTFIRNS